MDTTDRSAISVASNVEVVGYDPEYADFDNPRGELYRTRYFMVAANEYGEVRAWGSADSEEGIEFEFVQFAPPVAKWPVWRYTYGSQAYIDSGVEAQRLIYEMEEDLGVDWAYRTPEVALSLGLV